MEYHYQNNLYKSGIYKITNKLNGRIYIGSSKLFKVRWRQHSKALRNNKHSNKFLQRDFNKCGEEVFVFEIIEGTDGKTKEERLLIEEIYINKYFDSGKECYNFNTWAVAKEGPWSNDPEETKRKLSAASKKMWNDPEKAAAIRKSMKESLNDPEVSLSKQEGLLKSWQGNEKRRNAASERMTKRMGNDTPETEKIIETLKLSQPKGRDTFRKRMKEDLELHQTYIDIATKKAESLNERYRNDAEYKAMMDKKSIENIKAYNEKKIQSMPVKAPLISPDGKVYSDIRSLTAFAKEHGLDPSNLYKLYSGKLNEVKGWKFFVR